MARIATALVVMGVLGAGASVARPVAAEADEPPVYETVVTGTRFESALADAPIATEVIGRAELEATGADTVAEALAAHGGVEIERGLAGSVVSMQGLSSRYTLVLVDGQRVIGRLDGGLDLSRLGIEGVERIEIVKGPASALYGSDAIGGVINIVTRRARKPVEAEATSSIGTAGQLEARGRAGTRRGILRVSVTGSARRGDGWDLEPADEATTASAFESYDAGLALEVRPATGARVDADVRWMRRDLRGVDASAAGALFDRRNLTETVDLRLAPSWSPWPSTRLSASYHRAWYRDQYRSDQRGSDALDTDQDTREGLDEASLMANVLAGDHAVTAGLDGLVERLSTPRISGGAGDRLRGALFAQDEWRVARRLALVPAIRVDQDSRFGGHVTPRLAARLDPTDGVVVRLGAGAGYRAPDFKELYLFFENPGAGYLVEGNPALSPESSWSVTAAAEWRASSTVWASLGLFRHDLEDLITTSLVDDGGAGTPMRYSYVNVAEATSQGVEASVRWTPARRVVVDAAYSFTDVRDDDTGERVEGRAAHRVTLTARGRLPGGFELVQAGSFTPGVERDLLTAREKLQAVTEELATANEELQSSNEEFQSVNEELHSTVEELETSKEELQSINEELQTVNAELSSRADSLARANSDLTNLFDSTSLATLFLDGDCRIRRFTPATTEIFNIREGDEGRPITDFSSRLAGGTIVRDVAAVLQTLKSIEREVESADGTATYLLRVKPYRTTSNVVDGAVITLVDISERRRLERDRAYLAAIVQSSQDAIISHDLDGRITSWNSGAEGIYGYTESEMIGKPMSILLDERQVDEWPANLARLRQGKSIGIHDESRIAKNHRRIDVSLTISPIRDDQDVIVGASAVGRDISERKAAEQRAAILMAELDHRVKNILAVVSAVISQTFNANGPVNAARMEIEGRITAIARTQGLLTGHGGIEMTLKDLIATELAPYGNHGLKLTGDNVVVSSKTGVVLALALHELATNAAKYGALSVPDGLLEVNWQVTTSDGKQTIVLIWTERGGPPVKTPSRRGFGTKLIELSLVRGLGATVNREFLAEGVRCQIQIPMAEDIGRVPYHGVSID